MSAAGGKVFVLMGVSGSGKTTVGKALASSLECPFYDGDDFHSAENIAKMAGGRPLDDSDRVSWLAILAALIQDRLNKGEKAVLACSALKKRYRDQLRIDDRVGFIFLDGDFELIWRRMLARPDHYMKPEMLRSQFETLEVPEENDAIRIPIDRSESEVVDLILEAIKDPLIL